jgi:hypothetical protein
MSSQCQQNLERMHAGRFAEQDSSFCLVSLRAYATDDEELAEKRQDLLSGTIEESEKDYVRYACNIASCSINIVENIANGATDISGECSNICLRNRMKEVGRANQEEGKRLYGELIDEVGVVVGGGSAGSFCPRVECDYSFGCSEDRVYGSAGECSLPVHPQQTIIEDLIAAQAT